MANEFAVVFNTNTQTFQHQTDQQELDTYGVPDATPDQLAELNAAFQVRLTKAQPTKNTEFQIKMCKQLHNGKFGSVQVFTDSVDGVISPGQLLANVLNIAYDDQDYLIDLDG